jgi:hypothetical protein
MEISTKTLQKVIGGLLILNISGFLVWYFVPAYRLGGGILFWASLLALVYLVFWLFWRFVRQFVKLPTWNILAGLVFLFLSSLALTVLRPDLHIEAVGLFWFSVLSCFPLLVEELGSIAQRLIRGTPSIKPAPSSAWPQSPQGPDSDNPWGPGTIPTLGEIWSSRRGRR